jgi:23S rRNA pseudouridine1911/1915/1917 synthase
VLAEAMPEISRSRIQATIRAGGVSINGVQAVKPSSQLEGGEWITVELPPLEPVRLTPEPIPLDIVYEDNSLIALNKPPGMVVHPSAGHASGTLVQAVLAHCPDLSGIGGVARPGVVHRLDRDTSGLILMAKTDRAHAAIQEAFRSRRVEKTYLAIVDGRPPTPTGRIEAAVGRDARSRVRMAIVPEKRGRAAVTEYAVDEEFPENALLHVRPRTGRTHQIRVHLAFLGCPVTGDTVYGRKRPSLPVARQMLHAWKLSLTLPELGAVTWEAPVPDDFRVTLEDLRRLSRAEGADGVQGKVVHGHR